jgi:hypothetical protein
VGTRIAVTSIVRRAGGSEVSGFLRVVDLARRRVLLEAPVPESARRADDPNPRGGARGARGVSVHGERLVVANFDRAFVIDPSWRVVDELTHPWTGAIHDVLAEEDGVWVTCSSCDLLMKLGWDGAPLRHWTVRNDRRLARRLGLRHLPAFDPEVDYRDPVAMYAGVYNTVHLNAATRGRAGLLVSLGRIDPPRRVWRRRATAALARLAGRFGVERRARGAAAGAEATPVPRVAGSSFALLAVREGETEVLFEESGVAVPNHNVIESGDALVYNDSNRGRLVAVRPGESAPHRGVDIPGSPSFARGLAQLDEDIFLVGSQAPAAVHTVDLAAGRVTSSLELDGEATETVYAIAVLPDSFEDPTPQLRFGSSR